MPSLIKMIKKPKSNIVFGHIILLLLFFFASQVHSAEFPRLKWMSGKGVYHVEVPKKNSKPGSFSGSFSLVRDWQKPENIIAQLAHASNLPELSPQDLKRLIPQASASAPAKVYRNAKMRMACGFQYLSRKGVRVMHDFCIRSDLKELRSHLQKAGKINIPKPFFATTEISPKIMAPAGFFRVSHKNDRQWFIDTSGLVELEYAHEKVGSVRISKSGVAIYRESMAKVLARDYGLKLKKNFDAQALPVNKPVCYQFFGADRTSVLCLRDLPPDLPGASKNKKPPFYVRHSLMAIFPNKDIDENKLVAELTNTIARWGKSK